jgi:uncharacterized membrane protein
VRVARLGFVLLTATWIVLLLAAPLTGLGASVSGLTYAFGSLICHQRPERSFYVDAAQLPVCARCFGLYAGAALGSIAGLMPCAALSWSRSPSPLDFARGDLWDRRRARLRMVLLAAAVPTAVTWTNELLGLWSPANLTRFIAALPLGLAVAVTVNYIGCARRQQTGHRSPRIHT